MLFTTQSIGSLNIKNRFVCSATQDNEIDTDRQILPQTLSKYKTLARENIGLTITGGVSPVNMEMIEKSVYDYEMIRVKGIEQIADVVHKTAENCKVVTQLSQEPICFVPSAYVSP